MNKYTGRNIAIFTDVHGLIEPLEAIINDIKKRGIKEIYSLGDNVGTGPNPHEVMEIIRSNNVISVAGNAEYYVTLGVEPFMSYFDNKKILSRDWTQKELSKKDISDIKNYPPSIELMLGGKRIALCHFANDVRIDYTIRSTWTYQEELKYGKDAYKQFLYTNSDEQKKDILKNSKLNKPFCKGFKSSFKEPLFNGKKITDFDYIFQGHVHFPSIEKTPINTIYTVCMAYKHKNIATYIILKEKEIGFDIEEVFVTFDRDKMLERVRLSDMPDKSLINKYLRH